MTTICDLKNTNNLLRKSNKIHYVLLTFVQNELNERKKILNNFYSYSTKEKAEVKEEEELDKFNKKNKESDNTFFNYDEDEDEDGEESSSDMSCEEEYID